MAPTHEITQWCLPALTCSSNHSTNSSSSGGGGGGSSSGEQNQEQKRNGSRSKNSGKSWRRSMEQEKASNQHPVSVSAEHSVTVVIIVAAAKGGVPIRVPTSILILNRRQWNIKADSTLRSSRAVPHPSTNRALCRLTSEVGRDPVHSTRYGRQRKSAYAMSE